MLGQAVGSWPVGPNSKLSVLGAVGTVMSDAMRFGKVVNIAKVGELSINWESLPAVSRNNVIKGSVSAKIKVNKHVANLTLKTKCREQGIILTEP